MKKLWIFSAVFLLAGVIMLLVPIHMQPTGAVLLLLGLGMGISALLWRKPTKKKQTAIQIIAVAASAGVVILMAAMGILTSSGQSDWKNAEKSDYAIVLGNRRAIPDHAEPFGGSDGVHGEESKGYGDPLRRSGQRRAGKRGGVYV